MRNEELQKARQKILDMEISGSEERQARVKLFQKKAKQVESVQVLGAMTKYLVLRSDLYAQVKMLITEAESDIERSILKK